jgi:uncharacterized metal-binding protein
MKKLLEIGTTLVLSTSVIVADTVVSSIPNCDKNIVRVECIVINNNIIHNELFSTIVGVRIEEKESNLSLSIREKSDLDQSIVINKK